MPNSAIIQIQVFVLFCPPFGPTQTHIKQHTACLPKSHRSVAAAEFLAHLVYVFIGADTHNMSFVCVCFIAEDWNDCTVVT